MNVENAPKVRRPIASGNLTVGSGSNAGTRTLETDRYRIEITKGQVRVFDKQTNTEVKVWGDPHVITSDGDKAQFQRDNLTLELKDGTKITVKPTEMDGNGVALVESVLVLNGNRSVVAENVSGSKEITISESNSGAKARTLDRQWADGTVLTAGDQVDDLFHEGREIVGEDPSQRFNEHLLDGRGGEAMNDWTDFDLNDELYRDLDEIKTKLQELKAKLRAEMRKPEKAPSDDPDAEVRDESKINDLQDDIAMYEDRLKEVRADIETRRKEAGDARADARAEKELSKEDNSDAEFDNRMTAADKYDKLSVLEDELDRLSERLADQNLPEGVRQRLMERKSKLQSSLDLNRAMILSDMEQDKKKVDAFINALQRLS